VPDIFSALSSACTLSYLLRLPFGLAVENYIGAGQDVAIPELAQLIGEKARFNGKTRFDSSGPKGMPHGLLDVAKINGLG
jgi:hypothetical protein